MITDYLKEILETYNGRRFVHDIIEDCGVLHQSYRGDDRTEFREGKRYIGLAILNAVFTLDHNYFNIILDEQKEREEHDRERRANERGGPGKHRGAGADRDPGKSDGFYVPIDGEN